jgi:hypothetical protein
VRKTLANSKFPSDEIRENRAEHVIERAHEDHHLLRDLPRHTLGVLDILAVRRRQHDPLEPPLVRTLDFRVDIPGA